MASPMASLMTFTMASSMRKALITSLASLVLLASTPAQAWWDFGHQLSGEIAWAHLSDPVRQRLFDILREHPRYQEDLLSEMPIEISLGPLAQRQSWLLGRAAYWPDVVRNLPEAERQRYNRANWHYIDGALVRDAATRQGNTYIDISRFPDRQAQRPEQIQSEQQVDNILVALDYNTRVFTSASSSLADKAVALCWILHLGGDIHQPLHTGTAFSRQILKDGDAGGNGVPTDRDLNLHARWDGALSDRNYADTLQDLLVRLDLANLATGDTADWSAWMAESRDILHSGAVYDERIQGAIRSADATGDAIEPVKLETDYVAAMEDIAAERITLAGWRLAQWLEQATR